MIQTIKNNYHLTKAVAANVIYSFPAKKMKIIAVTGTDGKTTTVNLIYHILKNAGLKVGMLSTIGAYINEKEFDTGLHVTTPSSFLLQKLLKEGVKAGLEYFVLEVTSHGIDQNRVWGIPITVGVLTNVTEEHLDYHGTYDKYLKTKLRLFNNCKIKIVNQDDRSYDEVSKRHYSDLVTYGLKDTAQVNPSTLKYSSQLEGDFNTYNTLAAIAVSRAIGIRDEIIAKNIASFLPPKGRQNVVYNNGFKVVIDFAHTPNSIKNILQAVRKITNGRLIHVFGSAGERDKYKRPEMGALSSEFSDVIILTAEDPRSENVENIMNDIQKTIINYSYDPEGPRTKGQFAIFKDDVKIEKDTKYLFRIPDRQEAINAAVGLAQRGDTVIITGKGHEKSMNYGHGEIEWDEYEAVHSALKKKGVM